VAPDRKVDPGAHFPWKELSKQGIGIMPKVKMHDRLYARLMPRSPKKLEKLFAKAGYKAANMNRLVAAFQQHYEPDKQGLLTRSTIARLHAVARYNKKQKGYAS
jgi:N-acetylmuramoyl-L-alanine amidase